ncbi:P-loop containing nucleoside triphosphate hydrolases superfamily protein isoform X1 [Tasmannia lanceolata]|uniref:P-loop containing nucleoside triphosphate hydrolases superfamily protein isoform X1 n=1 Tax=Tasmannia lanceolata TaxID=3420 RepID=UPI0040637189
MNVITFSCSIPIPKSFSLFIKSDFYSSKRNSSLGLYRRNPRISVLKASEDGFVVVEDDLHALLQILPRDLRENLQNESRRAQLLEVVLDLGRFPEARFLGESGGQYLRNTEVSMKELEEAQKAVGEFGGDNRAGIEGTLHRISAIRSRKGLIVGLTCRVGRAVTGHVEMVRDLLDYGESILFLGRPGVGKTTVMREIARVLADELHKRVVIVDTSNEIGGDGDVPHAAIGGARRMQVPNPSMQHKVMIEAVENHMPQVVIVDEIGTEVEALACRSIAERGVMLIGTAHGERLENIIKNPTLTDLVGGVETVTLGDDEARARGSQKSILERKAPPTFPFLIEMRERNYWVTHRTERSVDMLLQGKRPLVEVRRRDEQFRVVIERWKAYDGDGI